MIRHYSHIPLFILVALCFWQCAQVTPLSGGERDTTPPKLIEAIPAQSAINFTSSVISLKFNEYIQLKDLKNQLLVSPGLKTDPDISVDGKKLKIVINPSDLLPHTTYKLYFGKSIADMTEGNAIPNFEYVFSTGSYIDSLKVNGLITEAFNDKPVSDVLVGLYSLENTGIDSLAYKRSPDYVTRTTSSGEYSFGNLPAKKFKLLAFSDKNKNYLYDGESEKIGFHTSELQLLNDTNISVKLFQEQAARLFIKKTLAPYYGMLNVIYNKENMFNTKVLNKEEGSIVVESDKGKEKDTVSFYYTGITDTVAVLIYDNKGKGADTVKVVSPKLNLKRKKELLFNTSIQTGILPLNKPLKLNFLNLIDTLKTNGEKLRLIYKKDTVMIEEPVKLHYLWPAGIEVANKIYEGINYKLKIDSAAFYDYNGRYNDSSIISFKSQSRTDLGKVALKLLFNKKQSYLIQLLNEHEKTVKEENISFSLSSSNAVSIDFTDVLPGTYTVKIIFDNNENKKWDTGNYLMNKQPEKAFISSKQIKVLADWDVEEEILIK